MYSGKDIVSLIAVCVKKENRYYSRNMPKECAAVGCRETQIVGTEYSFHTFPKNETLKREWIIKVNREDPKTMKLWEPKPHDCLCSKHFETSCFTLRTTLSMLFGLKYKRTLQPGAIPTLFEYNEAARKRKEGSLNRSAFVKRLRKEVLNQMLTLEDSVTDSSPDQASPNHLLIETSSTSDACLQVQPSTCTVKQQTAIKVKNVAVQTDSQQQCQTKSSQTSGSFSCQRTTVHICRLPDRPTSTPKLLISDRNMGYVGEQESPLIEANWEKTRRRKKYYLRSGTRDYHGSRKPEPKR